MKKGFSLLLALTMLLSLAACGERNVPEWGASPVKQVSTCLPVAALGAEDGGKPIEFPFTDVPEGRWYRSFVQTAYEKGLLSGVTAAAFRPDDPLTLGHAVTLAARIYARERGEVISSGGSPWYREAYDYCVDHRIIDKKDLTLDEMGRAATRLEMTAVLDSAMTALWINIAPEVQVEHIPDVEENGDSGSLVYRWYRAGIISGDEDGTFNGSRQISRAETAKILCEIEALREAYREKLPDKGSGTGLADADGFLPEKADFSVFNTLDAVKHGCSFGTARDEDNRPKNSLKNNSTYGQYDAVFIKEDSNKIYLTFDEGYEAGHTGEILDVLREKDVHAVFLVQGSYVRKQPELVQRMIDEEHVLGSHSSQHHSLPDMSLEDAYGDTRDVHNLVAEQFGYNMKLYRFPSGEFNEQTLAMLQNIGYRSLFWSYAHRDWILDEQPDPEESLEKILQSAHPGGIYLLHAVSSTNTEILGDVIDGFREMGYEIGDPSDLLPG